MTDSLDCKWVEAHFEALFCDRLEPEQDRLVREHMETCASCRREIEALNAIDPLVKRHFQRGLAASQSPRITHTGRLLGVSTAALALVGILLFVILRAPQTPPAAPAQSVAAQAPVDTENQPPAPPKNPDDTNPPAGRTKPANEVSRVLDSATVARPAASDSADVPDLLVTDPAGYSHRLEDFRGHVTVIAVWSKASPEAIANFERLYKAHGADPRFRFLGVSNERLAKPSNVTFPIFYNKGSKVLGVRSGEFALVDEKGEVTLRGSLAKDFDSLRKALQGN
jgi:hypothetical protein